MNKKMSLSFTKALPIFFILQVAILITLMKLSERIKAKSKVRIPSNVSAIMIKIFYVLFIIGGFATTCMNFRDTYLYNLLILLLPSVLILLVVSNFSSKFTFATVIMWHYMLIAPEIKGDLISVTEGVHMTRTMVVYGRWLPELAHNPAYNPFPTIAFVRAALSFMTGLPWYSQITAWIILIAILIGFDSAIYVFSSKISLDNRVGIIAVIIFTLTPYLSITSHAYQVPATLFWLLSTYMLIQQLRSFQHRYAILATLFFFSAILTHPTAYIAMILPAAFLLVKYLGGIANFKLPKREYLNMTTTAMPILIIGLTRFAFESMYAYYVGKMFIDTIEDLALRIFLGEEIEIKSTLYEYGGVPFYQAFLWCITASLACALIIHDLMKKSVNPILFSLFLTACMFMGIGYVAAVIVRGTTQIHRGSYVAFTLLVPLAAMAVKRIIDTKSKPLVLALLLMIIFSSCLAINDPEFSPSAAKKVRGIPAEVGHSSIEDLIKASYIINFAKDLKVIDDLYLYSKNTVIYERVMHYGERIKMVYNRVGDALYKELYISGYTINDQPIYSINYILPIDYEKKLLTLNLIYCNGKEYILKPM